MLKTDAPIIVEQEFPDSVEVIWSALTNPDEMRKWFFEVIPDFKAEVGFKTEFHLSNEGRDFPHLWEVVTVEPEKKLVVNWQFGGYPGSSNVVYEVISGESENLVRVTTEVLEDHPQDIPEFKRESGVQGWKYFINGRLKEYLDALR